MFKNLFLTALCMMTLGGVALAAPTTWTSPHKLSLEEKATVSLLPFPQKVAWKQGGMKVGKSAPR
ncbi:MAG: hypothetical protein II295_01730, partial [Akkermansia sp.]|nr:hypothetical protein [Akkermansia sp.]